MGKNFLGLDGLKHFWSKAKSWIAEQITAEVTAKIAEIVANAPEDLDTLKEIADWISAHANDAAAMNTEILANTSDIATLKTTVAGKSDTGHTHTKSEITDFPTSLPANGGTATKATQDGSGNVITSTYVKKSGDTLTSSTSDTPLYVNTTASGITKSWIGFQIGSVSKNYIGADQNGLYSYTNSKNNKILDTSAQTLTDEEKTQVRSNIGAGTSSLTIGTTETTAAAGNHTHSGYLTAHQDISGKLNVDGSNATNTGTSAIIHSLDTATGDVTDDTEIITSNASGYSSSDTKYYKRAGNKLWNYIKGKISSVLGLTKDNYGGKASTAGTADSANNGFNSSTTTDSTPGWGYLTSDNGYSNGRTYSFANGGGIATAEKDTKSSLQVDGDLYVHEGLDKVATLNDIPTSIPANGGTASSCSGNSATATQLQTARTINIQDSSATYTGTGASFNGSGDATIKLPSTIKANEFKIYDGQQSIAYRSKSYNGFKMHEVQTKALYIEGRESDAGDSGGLAITNDSVTVFGAGDTDGVFRVVNEDKAGDGSKTAPSIFNIFKDGQVTMTNRLTAPSATIGDRTVITGTYSASDGSLNRYTN